MHTARLTTAATALSNSNRSQVQGSTFRVKPVKKITVGDYNTKQQIDADRAYWVIGGDKMGVMTARAKWAFDTKDAADNFMNTHGGRPATFGEVMKAAFEDMYEDTLMIQKKRKMMKMKKN